MSGLDVLSSPSVGFLTPPSSQSVFPNYKLEIQDGQGAGVEVNSDLEFLIFPPLPPQKACTTTSNFMWCSLITRISCMLSKYSTN